MLSMTERPLEPQSSMDCYALELLRVQDDFTTLRARRVLHHKMWTFLQPEHGVVMGRGLPAYHWVKTHCQGNKAVTKEGEH